MTNYSASIANPNKALWEKGDFTQIAAFMRQLEKYSRSRSG